MVFDSAIENIMSKLDQSALAYGNSNGYDHFTHDHNPQNRWLLSGCKQYYKIDYMRPYLKYLQFIQYAA